MVGRSVKTGGRTVVMSGMSQAVRSRVMLCAGIISVSPNMGSVSVACSGV